MEKRRIIILIIVLIIVGGTSFIIWKKNSATPQEKILLNYTKNYEVATSTFSNFSFEYPADGTLGPYSWEGVVREGSLHLYIPAPAGVVSAGSNIFIETESPNDKTLDYYKKGYPISDYFTLNILTEDGGQNVETRNEVRINSSEEMVINEITMLKQRYDIGQWRVDFEGNRIFYTRDETGIENGLRYVFFDGKNYVIISGDNKGAPIINRIAQSIRVF